MKHLTEEQLTPDRAPAKTGAGSIEIEMTHGTWRAARRMLATGLWGKDEAEVIERIVCLWLFERGIS